MNRTDSKEYDSKIKFIKSACLFIRRIESNYSEQSFFFKINENVDLITLRKDYEMTLNKVNKYYNTFKDDLKKAGMKDERFDSAFKELKRQSHSLNNYRYRNQHKLKLKMRNENGSI